MNPHDETDETHPLFPSGEWEGFYTYATGPGAERFPMSLVLYFRDGAVSGEGVDLIGPFHWRGHYDKENLLCHITKYYLTHAVYYDGHVDENGIWGMWNIGESWRGGFHIWPKREGQAAEQQEQAAKTRQEQGVKKWTVVS